MAEKLRLVAAESAAARRLAAVRGSAAAHKLAVEAVAGKKHLCSFRWNPSWMINPSVGMERSSGMIEELKNANSGNEKRQSPNE